MSAEELKRRIARSQETAFLLTLRTQPYSPLVADLEKTLYRKPLLALKDKLGIGGHSLDQRPHQLANSLGNIEPTHLAIIRTDR